MLRKSILGRAQILVVPRSPCGWSGHGPYLKGRVSASFSSRSLGTAESVFPAISRSPPPGAAPFYVGLCPISHGGVACTAMYRRRAGSASVRPLIAFVLTGILGAGAGALVGSVTLRLPPIVELHPATVSAPPLVAAASIAAGVLTAWFLTILVLSWTPGRFHCPRCCTANGRCVLVCRACLLPFS